MTSKVYQEIVQRIPLLTAEERARLLGLLQIDSGESGKSNDPVPTQGKQNGAADSPIRLVPVKSFDEERKWISQHRAQYRGQFVALNGDKLLAHGNDEGDVIDQARDAGVQAPFVTYIETEAEEYYLSGWLNS
jgi:hypothetical protein